MRYRADITTGALKVPESRIIAALLLRGLDEAGWKEAIYGQNVLQTRSPKTSARLTLLLRGRLVLMAADLWKLVRDGSGTVATQACLAAAVKHSALLGDFLDLVLREQYTRYAKALSNTVWDDYILNRSQLEQDARAAPALRRMQDILSARSPYGLIQEAEGLITTVEGVNAALLAEHRTATCQKLDDVIAALTKDIEAAQGDDTLRSICLGPLAKLRGQVAGEASIAHIVQAEQQAPTLFDAAQGCIQEFVRKMTEKPSSQGTAPEQQPKPLVKKVHPIKPASLVKATYLETLDDVHGFLDQLRTEMEDAILKGERIQIR